MSTLYETVTEPREKYIGIRCDRCGRVTLKEEDPMEWEEYVCIYHEGGFTSVFGDGARIDVDFCQYCVLEVLGPWLRVKE